MLCNLESVLTGTVSHTAPNASEELHIDQPRRPHVTIFGHDIYTFKSSRYSFFYQTLVPPAEHSFWDALCGPDGMWFAETALICSNPAYGIDKDTASVALSVGLRPLRLAVSRLNVLSVVPADIVEFLIRVRWLVSIADYYDAEWTLFKWPPSEVRGPSRPARKRPVHPFLDLEAEGSEDDFGSDAGEDDYESDASFSDVSDKPEEVFHHASLRVAGDNLPESDEELRAIASRFEERALKDRARTTEESSPAVSELTLARAVDVSAAPLYVFSVPPSTEIDFMMFLDKSLTATSAFTRKLGSGFVYVETSAINAVQKALNSYAGAWRIGRRPNVLEVLDSMDTLALTPAIEHIGRFRRLKHRRKGLKSGDLMFATAPQTFLAIPRIMYEPMQGVLPQALFDEERFERVCGMRVDERRNELVIVDDGRFVYQRNGLQRVEWDEHRWRSVYKNDVAIPSDWELELFAHANDKSMQLAPNLEAHTALSTGDRVVAVAGPYEGRTGRIDVAWTEDGTSSKQKGRWAVVQDEKSYQTQFSVSTQSKEESDYFCTKVLDLRPHIFCATGLVEIGDQVRVVDGDHLLGKSAIVVDRFETGLLEIREINVVAEEDVVVNMSDVMLDIDVGDVVILIRGKMVGSVGMIVAFLKDGSVSFFPCDHGRIRDIVSSGSKLSAALDGKDLTFPVSIRDMKPFRDDWYAFLPEAERNVTQQLHTDWVEEMYTGKGYQDIPVMISGQHQLKGYFGTIVGYHYLRNDLGPTAYVEFRQNEKAKLTSFLRPNDDLVSLTVQFEGKLEKIVLPITHVVERYSRRPLWEFKLMRSFLELVEPEREHELRVQLPYSLPAVEAPSVSAGDSAHAQCVDLPGETTGAWFTHPEFVNRRIDVKILGLGTTRFPKHSPRRTSLYEGETGYLVPFKYPVLSGSFTKRNFKVQLDRSTKTVGVPADAVRPCRENLDGTSIAKTKGRVIVIGPDIAGRDIHIGQYAETMPGSAPDPQVLVRFQKNFAPEYGTFALSSLCRARNIRVMSSDGVVADASEFH
ncbi:hypothetical protein B0H12DRAFT_1232095 [Mycena haematopus]|nr:hypothetical protein B0H12DRAFT_1232095 [Mycena haematopus]